MPAKLEILSFSRGATKKSPGRSPSAPGPRTDGLAHAHRGRAKQTGDKGVESAEAILGRAMRLGWQVSIFPTGTRIHVTMGICLADGKFRTGKASYGSVHSAIAGLGRALDRQHSITLNTEGDT